MFLATVVMAQDFYAVLGEGSEALSVMVLPAVGKLLKCYGEVVVRSWSRIKQVVARQPFRAPDGRSFFG